MATHLFTEIGCLGYTGCYTHLARFIASWRRREEDRAKGCSRPPGQPLPRDPTTGRPLSPLAAALCIKPRTQPSVRQASIVDAMKIASPSLLA